MQVATELWQGPQCTHTRTHARVTAAALTHVDRRTDIQLRTISVEQSAFMAPQCRRKQ